MASFGGALRYSLNKLIEFYPNAKIVICSQLYRFWMDAECEFLYDSDTYVINGHSLLDFCAKTKEIADEYKLYFIDNYRNSGIKKDTRQLCFAGADGTHPVEYGRRLIAANMVRELSAMC